MKPKKLFHWVLVWILALVITAAALIYQNLTGPTNPKRIELWLSDSQVYKFKLPRSHGGNANCLIELNIPDTTVTGEIIFRRYPTSEEWQKASMVRAQDKLVAFLPYQPPAGKLEYYFLIKQEGKVVRMPAGEQIIIRFRGDVPAKVIIPHASLMFIAMLLSNLTLLLALFNFRQYRLYAYITTAVLFIGGLILGPMVQKYAFGQYWTGFPFGLDLTDNKTLIAFICWLFAIAVNLKKDRRYVTVLAGLVMLVIFSIPHSARGSELDPGTGKIKTGMVLVLPSKNYM